jgi:hypothetical protein
MLASNKIAEATTYSFRSRTDNYIYSIRASI